MAKVDSKVFRLRYSEYTKFASNEAKETELMHELVIKELPGLKFATSVRKRILFEQFKEIVSGESSSII